MFSIPSSNDVWFKVVIFYDISCSRPSSSRAAGPITIDLDDSSDSEKNTKKKRSPSDGARRMNEYVRVPLKNKSTNFCVLCS